MEIMQRNQTGDEKVIRLRLCLLALSGRDGPARFRPSENGKLSAFRGVSNEYQRTWSRPSSSEAENSER